VALTKDRPYGRKTGGTVFFVRYAYTRRKLRLLPVCTGVLVVDRIISDRKRLLESRDLPDSYKRLYEKDLKDHLHRDAKKPPRTKEIRGKHIIVGGSKSFWLGRRCVNLVPILRRLKINGVVNGLEHNRVVRALTDIETAKLYKAVTREWRDAKPIQTPNPKQIGRFRTCKICY